MKRFFDIVLGMILAIIFLMPFLFISLLIKLTSRGSVIHWSERIGRNNVVFIMPKFRTMKAGSPQLATHLFEDPAAYLTPVGGLLRKFSLDELPQIYSIIKGDMSFVGPRPALFNQEDLTELRTLSGIHRISPGLTGYAQINGRDEISISEKVKLDEYYLNNRSFLLDITILLHTLIKVLRCYGVRT